MEVGLSGSGKCRCKVSKYYMVEKCVKSFERRPRNPSIFNIIRWVAGTKDSLTKRLMCQVLFFFFHNFLQNVLHIFYLKNINEEF